MLRTLHRFELEKVLECDFSPFSGLLPIVSLDYYIQSKVLQKYFELLTLIALM